jgi:preflagellin peptidase FlaK
MDLLHIIDALRVLLAICVFGVASYADYRTRTIENHVWLIGGAAGSVLLFAHLFTISAPLLTYILALLAIALFFTPYINLERYRVSETTEMYIELTLYISIASATFLTGFYWFTPENVIPMGIVGMHVLVRAFYELNIIHGGADAKALMLISLMFPTYPQFLCIPIYKSQIPLIEQVFPFTLTVLFNAVFWFIFYPLALLVYNAAKGSIKLPQALFGYRMSIDEVKGKFVWLMEHPVDGKIITRYTPDKDEDERIAEEIAELKRMGRREVWVTPQIPFIIPIFAGLLISIVAGNILFILMGIAVPLPCASVLVSSDYFHISIFHAS